MVFVRAATATSALPNAHARRVFANLAPQEDRQLRTILRALDGVSPRATGKLHTDLALGIDRKQFDGYLNALARAGLITLTTDTFTNAEGNVINFKRASLTHEGRTRDEGDALGVLLPEENAKRLLHETTSHEAGQSPLAGKRSKLPQRSRSASPLTASNLRARRRRSNSVCASGARLRPRRPASPPLLSLVTPF